jgi:hypothetical protein
MIPAKHSWINKTILASWLIVMLVGLAALSLNHMASLPAHSDEALLVRSLLKLRRVPEANFLVHVIYKECSCSRALFGHLIARGPFRGAEEMVLFVGADLNKERLAKRAGFGFTAVSPQELAARFGLEAAPVFILFDSKGQLRMRAAITRIPRPSPRLTKVSTANCHRRPTLQLFRCLDAPSVLGSKSP